MDMGAVAIRLTLRGAAAAQGRRFRFGGKVFALLEIPAFVVRIRHDELFAERRPPVHQIRSFLRNGDGDASARGRCFLLVFHFQHTIRIVDALVVQAVARIIPKCNFLGNAL